MTILEYVRLDEKPKVKYKGNLVKLITADVFQYDRFRIEFVDDIDDEIMLMGITKLEVIEEK